MNNQDEHDYTDDFDENDLYGDAPEDYKEMQEKQNFSHIPKQDQEKFPESVTEKTMDLKFINGKLHQRYVTTTYLIGVETHFCYGHNVEERWGLIPSETIEEN